MEKQDLVVRRFDSQNWAQWEAFVSNSPQGTIFSERLWLSLLGLNYHLYGCFKGDEMVGGVVACEDAARPDCTSEIIPLTPFQGILFRDNSQMRTTTRESLERKTASAMADALEKDFQNLTFVNHYTIHDIRPFYWMTYGRPHEYTALVRYTYVVDTGDMDRAWNKLDENTRYEINKARKRDITVVESDDFALFDGMHERTFERQGNERDVPASLLQRVYANLKQANRCQLYLARTADGIVTSGVLAIWDTKRAYYLLGGSEPNYRSNGSASLALWTMFEKMSARFKEIDLVGCNSPKRGAFKAGFGGILKHYFVVSLKRTR